MRRILVVDDDRDALISITNVLRAEYPHLDIRVAATQTSAKTLVSAEPFDLVLASDGLGEGLGIPTVALRKPIDPERLLELIRAGKP